jgi:hypothetical protein
VQRLVVDTVMNVIAHINGSGCGSVMIMMPMVIMMLVVVVIVVVPLAVPIIMGMNDPRECTCSYIDCNREGNKHK